MKFQCPGQDGDDGQVRAHQLPLRAGAGRRQGVHEHQQARKRKRATLLPLQKCSKRTKEIQALCQDST